MGYKISPDLTEQDYEALAECFGFGSSAREFIEFVVDQQRQAWNLPKRIGYPMQIADGPPLDMSDVKLVSDRPDDDLHRYVDQVAAVQVSRPPMVYGGGRA